VFDVFDVFYVVDEDEVDEVDEVDGSIGVRSVPTTGLSGDQKWALPAMIATGAELGQPG